MPRTDESLFVPTTPQKFGPFGDVKFAARQTRSPDQMNDSVGATEFTATERLGKNSL